MSDDSNEAAPRFKEQLPDSCPTDGAIDQPITIAYRVVQSPTPTETDFHSHALLGKPLSPTMDACRWSSCSLFVCKTTVMELAQRMPKLRFPNAHVSTLSIPSGAGYSLIKKKKHVDFWMFDGFDPVAAISQTVKA